MPVNPYEAEARTRKAVELLHTLEAHVQHVGGTLDDVAVAARNASPELWAKIAAEAGVHPPSVDTVAQVIRLAETAAERRTRADARLAKVLGLNR